MGGQQKKIMGFKVSHKPVGFDLMQNCDLPPPSKVFLGSDKTVILSMNKVCNISGREKGRDSKHDGAYQLENGDDEKDKRELLKALKASQTRAREAEKMVAILRKEKDGLSVALLEEAMQLFACRQRVRLLELQVLTLQQKPAMLMPAKEAVGLPHEETVSVSWVLALIFSLGIGVATALAWGY